VARPRHPKKDLEAILRLCEAAGWRVEKPSRGYFKVKCGCPDKHMRTVHLTPSDPNYGKNLLGWLRRRPCWRQR